MANKDFKWEENAKGKYYVDENCIAAKFCVAAAPNNFRMSESGHAYVYKQPETPEEEEQSREAVAGCPVNAIGDDDEE
ncbi:ferredoxin [Acidobacteria bacterium AH-259-A15]|nr:ferredoxin [Acidobacteria bacterium AH-259-A15]